MTYVQAGLLHPLQDKLDALPPDVRAVAWELAYMLRDAEREACAKICDEIARGEWESQSEPPGRHDAAQAVAQAAEAIRAR